MGISMNIGILITGRLKSQRLPKKILRPINGRPMLEYLVDRLKQSKYGKNIILCTSTAQQDDPLVEFSKHNDINCYRGDPNDVLARNVMAAKYHGIELVMSCTADNPFIDITWMDKLASSMKESAYDYGAISGLPFGCFSYSFTQQAGEKACQIKANTDTEVWGGYFTETKLFKCLNLKVDDPEFIAPNYRLTVDEMADFILAEKILTGLSQFGTTPPLPEIIKFLEKNPELATLNQHIKQVSAKPIKLL